MEKNQDKGQEPTLPGSDDNLGMAPDSAQAAAATNEEPLANEELKRLQEENRKHYDNYLRALAEVENTKKRGQRDREEYLKYANVALIKKLLPIIDDLHRAVEVARQSSDFEGLSRGVEMTARNLDDLLTSEGVQVIAALGQPFDPQYHQALAVEPRGEYPENTVIEQLQPGYIMHDRVIRPSLVKVSA